MPPVCREGFLLPMGRRFVCILFDRDRPVAAHLPVGFPAPLYRSFDAFFGEDPAWKAFREAEASSGNGDA